MPTTSPTKYTVDTPSNVFSLLDTDMFVILRWIRANEGKLNRTKEILDEISHFTTSPILAQCPEYIRQNPAYSFFITGEKPKSLTKENIKNELEKVFTLATAIIKVMNSDDQEVEQSWKTFLQETYGLEFNGIADENDGEVDERNKEFSFDEVFGY